MVRRFSLRTLYQSMWLYDFPDRVDLLACVIQRARVVDDVIGGFDFFFVGELGGHAAGDFFLRGFERNAVSGGEAGYALFLGASYYDEAIKARTGAGLEKQRGFDHCDCAWVAASDFFHPFILLADDCRVNDAV